MVLLTKSGMTMMQLNESQLRKRSCLQAELMKILDEEEEYWFKRCHENWLLKGDKNTEYFHRVANGEKKRKQTIYSLQDGDHNISGDDNLVSHAIQYYKIIFGPGTEKAMDIDPNMCPLEDMVTEEENEELIKPFGEEEIKGFCFRWKRIRLQGQMAIQ
jgi:hypothetical protein